MMKNPLIPMVAITGDPTRETIFRYLEALRQKGINQVLLYPRSGCEVPYLTEPWFDTVGEFLAAAQQLEMAVWLYDDFNWPSGHAAGKVTETEAYRLRSIRVKGEEKGKISCDSVNSGSLFGEKFFPNLLSKEAVEDFIHRTHEQYAARFSCYFGTTVKGFFTDEPATAYCCTDRSVPYYDGMEADYEAAFGSSFRADMDACDENFLRQVTKLVGDRFRSCFLEPLAAWCQQHGLLLTGHLMGDHSPLTAIRQSGDFLKNLSVLSIPGIDEIDTNLKARCLLTMLACAQYAKHGQGAMAELFALGPCDLSYRTKTCMLYLCACFGIDHYFLGVSHLDWRGNRQIRDYFNHFGPGQPDFAAMPLLAREAKQAAEFAGKDYTPAVYIRYPRQLCADRLLSQPDMKPFYALAEELTRRQIPWKLLNDEQPGQIPVLEWDDPIPEDIQAAPLVTDSRGQLPEGILVRRYDDGSYLVVNYRGQPGAYQIDGKTVYLEGQGVYVSTQPMPREAQRLPLTEKFYVNHNGENLIRAMFVDDQTQARIVTDHAREIRFVVRKDAQVRLDGETLQPTASADLPLGMQTLYGTTMSIRLTPGEHSLTAGQDLKYLPTVLLLGDFAADIHSGPLCSLTLKDQIHPYTLGSFFGHFGAVTFTAWVTVPVGATALELQGCDLYTEVRLDDREIGKAICPPWHFPISRALQGKTVQLELTQYGTLGPIFGDVDYYDKTSGAVAWRGTPTPKGEPFGFTAAFWHAK